MLKQIREARKQEDKGFTLIELLIVIVILGVLAGIVVFAVSGITDRGKKSACDTTVRTVQTAGEAYYAKFGSYATAMGDLVTAGFLNAPAPAVTDIIYTVNAGTPPTLTVVKGNTGVCAP